MATKKNPYEQLVEISREVATWGSISNILEWDQETYMPSGAVDFRSSQNTLVGTHAHKLKVGAKFTKLLKALVNLETGEVLDQTLSDPQKSALRAWRRDYLKAVKLPHSYVKSFVMTTTKACPAWAEAKNTSNFKKFAAHLEKIVKLNQKKADYLGYKESPYDALLDLYEPDCTSSELVPLFESLKTGLKSILHKVTSKPPIESSFLKQDFDKTTQFEFSKTLLSAMGFTPETSRLDISSHPFCAPIHPTDTRMTTRIHADDIMSNIFSALHEGGHGIYGQNLPLDQFGTPLGEQTSLGIDESQSRFWETRIGRTRPFWHHFLPQLQAEFPQLNNVTLDQFYAAINTVAPSFIRVEADEVTYTLHVILRFEIEKMLMEGTLKVKDIPAAWNQKMQELLGITPPNDSLGCLQDIHWSMGSMGYFPTYALGNLYAAQFFEKFAHDNPDWESKVSHGNLTFIRDWLKTHIHQYGRQYNPQELILKVTGKPLSEKPYLDYLNAKYQKIYHF
ncbi:MAG: carboxypeptidase M32 [Rhabdochlamydiaceae bacterium]